MLCPTWRRSAVSLLPAALRPSLFARFVPSYRHGPTSAMLTVYHGRSSRSTSSAVTSSSPMGQSRLFLGLDVNTNSTGIAVVDEQEQVILCRAVSTKHVDSIIGKCCLLEAELQTIRQELVENRHYQLGTEVVCAIEDFLRNYAAGKSNRQVQFRLAQMNSTMQFVAYSVFGRRTLPIVVNVSSARATLNVRELAISTGVKEAVFRALSPMVPPEVFQWRMTPRSKQLCETNFDVTDALLVALFACRSAVVGAARGTATQRSSTSPSQSPSLSSSSSSSSSSGSSSRSSRRLKQSGVDNKE